MSVVAQFVSLSAFASSPPQPHLAQAWIAKSSGDGLPGQTGIESYLWESDDKKANPMGLQGHIFDYGESCKKIEVLFNEEKAQPSWYVSGSYYINCDAVDCCYDGDTEPEDPDLKMWDLPKPTLFNKVSYLGLRDTTELDGKPVKGAETWFSLTHVPFTKLGVNYTYYISHQKNTTQNTTDVITHRIDYGAGASATGSIVYGDFKVQHDIPTFRHAFYPPDSCNPEGKGHAMSCDNKKVREWNQKYFKHSAAKRGWL